MSKPSITISLEWEELDRIVIDAIVSDARGLANEIAMIQRMESPQKYHMEDLQNCSHTIDAYCTIIRYRLLWEEAEKIINDIKSIYKDHS
jgi:hypothetical protein